MPLVIIRCNCGNCESMPSNRECICCTELPPIISKFEESENEIGCRDSYRILGLGGGGDSTPTKHKQCGLQ